MSITICSFWVLRPEEHPEAEARNYPGMLRVLQKSCDKLGLRHLVLTDRDTARSELWPDGVEPWAVALPQPLMQAFTEAAAKFLECPPEDDTMFVGADCIFLKDPNNVFPIEPDLCITYRTPWDRHPINNGAQLIRRRSLAKVAPLYRRIADRCGTVWCDDQRALVAELAPMPQTVGTYERAGVKIAFLPMKNFNHLPKDVSDPCRKACMLHFRGKGRKQFFFDWAKAHGYA